MLVKLIGLIAVGLVASLSAGSACEETQLGVRFGRAKRPSFTPR